MHWRQLDDWGINMRIPKRACPWLQLMAVINSCISGRKDWVKGIGAKRFLQGQFQIKPSILFIINKY